MKPLASGRTADMYALGNSRVARRYRDRWSAEPEASVMGVSALIMAEVAADAEAALIR
jgi:hypothetical protein